jgi:hypothetical protein
LIIARLKPPHHTGGKKIGDSIKIDPEISVGNFLLGLIQMSVFKKTISDIPSQI